jgi:hypothetical protein
MSSEVRVSMVRAVTTGNCWAIEMHYDEGSKVENRLESVIFLS